MSSETNKKKIQKKYKREQDEPIKFVFLLTF